MEGIYGFYRLPLRLPLFPAGQDHFRWLPEEFRYKPDSL